MNSSTQKFAAILLAVFSLPSMLTAQSEPALAEPAAVPASTEVAPVPEGGASSDAIKTLEKRMEQLVTVQEGTNQILRTMAENVAKPPAPPTEVAVAPPSAETPTEDAVQRVQDNATYAWIIFGGALVFIMQAGFAMLELGVSRAKNSINVLMKNYLDFCIGSIVYLLVGFSLQFGTSWMGIVGWEAVWLPGFSADHKLWIFFFFQVGFASAGCTIVSGAMAERTKYVGYLVYSGIFVLLIYPMCAHWAWGSAGGAWGMSGTKGWLESLGFVDFAGSSVVHACGGACALAGVLIVGPRAGRFAKDGTPRLIAGHNIPLATLGAMLLLFGWFGFNAGSTLNANVSIGRIAVNTLLAPCSGALFAMLAMWLAQGKSDIGIAINGSLGGAVGITACCANVTPASALVIGLVSGLLTSGSTILLERLRLDDVAGAIPVHLVNGWWGTLCVAIFNEGGFDINKLGVQALGTFSISAVSFVGGYAIFKIVEITVGLRATEEEQVDGLDFAEHAVNAYPDFQTSERA